MLFSEFYWNGTAEIRSTTGSVPKSELKRQKELKKSELNILGVFSKGLVNRLKKKKISLFH